MTRKLSAIAATALFALAVWYADWTSFDAEFLKSVWLTAIPAFIGAAAAGYFIPASWTQRTFAALLLVAPVVEKGATSRRLYLPADFTGSTIFTGAWTTRVRRGKTRFGHLLLVRA